MNIQIRFLGTRLAISALISENGFHLPSVDIFKCDQWMLRISLTGFSELAHY